MNDNAEPREIPVETLLAWCIAYHTPSRRKCRCGWTGTNYEQHIADGVMRDFNVTKKQGKP